MAPISTRIPCDAWRVGILGGMASYLDGGALVTGGIALSLVMTSLGMTELDLGVMVSLLTGGLAVGAVAGGWLGDRYGRKRVLSADLAILAVGLALNMLAPTTSVLYLGVTVTGLAMGADLPCSISLVAEAAPKDHRGKMVGLSQLLWGMGGTVTAVLNAVLSNLGLPDVTQARVLWGHLFVVAILVWLLRRRLPESTEWLDRDALAADDFDLARSLGMAGTVRRSQLQRLAPHFMPLVLLGGFYSIGNLAPNTGGQFGFFILTQVVGMAVSAVSLVLLATVPLGLVLSLAFMRVVDTRWRYPTMVVGGIVQTVAYVVPAMLGVDAFTYLMALFIGMIGNAFIGEGLYKVRTQELFPASVRATAQGVTIFACRGVAALFALVTPAMAAWNLGGLLWLLAGLNLVTLGMGIWISRLSLARG